MHIMEEVVREKKKREASHKLKVRKDKCKLPEQIENLGNH